MFEEPGDKIQKVTKVLFWLAAIGFVLWAIVTAAKYEDLGYKDFPVIRFLFLLIGGPFISYVSALTLYGFGEIILASDRTYRAISKKSEPPIWASVNNPPGESAANKPWRCPQCNKSNEGSVMVCECGQHRR